MSIAEAKRHLQEVISDRKELNKQLRDCESKLSLDPPSKVKEDATSSIFNYSNCFHRILMPLYVYYE